MILKQAMMKSVNTIAAQLVARTGPEAVLDVARRCGIQSKLSPVYSLALGTSGISPLEMASAFATFASGGIRHRPFLIRRVEDPLGRVLQEHLVSGERMLDAGLTFQVVDMMRGVLDAGTAAIIRRQGFNLPAAGKTGTSDNYRDAWFCGFTPRLSVAVWVGFDRPVEMRDAYKRGITGGRAAAPVWAEFMTQATEGEPVREFVVPSDIRFRRVNPVTGRAVGDWMRDALVVALLKSQPTGVLVGRDQSGGSIIEEDLDAE